MLNINNRLRKLAASLTIVSLLLTLVSTSAFAAEGTTEWPEWVEFGALTFEVTETATNTVITTSRDSVATAEVTTEAAGHLADFGSLEAPRYAAVQIIGMAAELADCADDAVFPFTDVAADHEARGAVERAACHNVAFGQGGELGSPSETFDGASSLNRAEAVVMLNRAANWSALGLVGIEHSMTAAQTAEVPDWALESFQYAVALGVIQGKTQADGTKLMAAGDAVQYNDLITMNARSTKEVDVDAINTMLEEKAADAEATVGKAGTLTVALSDNTPTGQTVAGAVQNVPVAAFEFCATGSDAVTLNTVELTRTGISSDNAILEVALFNEMGERISKSRSFNDSEDTATVNLLGGGYELAGNTCEDLTAIGQVGEVEAAIATIPDANAGEEFALAIVSADILASSAAATSGDFPVVAETFKLGAVNAATLNVDSDSASADISVGEQGVELYNFVLDNTDPDSDIAFEGITFEFEGSSKEVDFMNFELVIDGDVVATTEEAGDDLVSFLLETPFIVESSDNVDGEIRANVMGGAGDTVGFSIDSELDVLATDLSFAGGGAIVDISNFNTGTTTTTSIEAGDVTIVAMDSEFDEVDDDRDNFVFGTLLVTANSGKDIEIQKLAVDIQASDVDDDGAGADLDEDDDGTGDVNLAEVLENVEVYDGKSAWQLDPTALADNEGVAGGGVRANYGDDTDDDATYEDDNLSIIVPEGETLELQIRADIQDSATFFGGAGAVVQYDMDDVTFEVSIGDMGAATRVGAGFYMEEATDDVAVTDVTPSSVSFRDVVGTEAGATITAINQSATKTAVVGTNGVVAMQFQVEASAAADLIVKEFTVTGDEVADAGAVSTGLFDNTRVASLSLYVDSVDPANLLDTQGGSQIAAEVVTFDIARSSYVDVLASETREFFITIDLVDDENQAGDTLDVSVTGADIEDDDGNVNITGMPAASTRNILIAGVGTLNVSADNTDSAADQAKYVLAGAESDFIASYEFVALNEDVVVKDLTITEGAAADLSTTLATVVLYDNDKTTEVARENITAGATTVTFTDIDWTVEEGSKNLYVKVIAHRMGKDQTGVQAATDLTLTLTVTDARGISGNTVANPAVTGATPAFQAVPVYASNIEFVNDYNGVERASTLVAGENVLAIIAVTAASHNNTDSLDGSTLDLVMDQLRFDVATAATTTLTNLSIERIGGSNGRFTDPGAGAVGDGVDYTVATKLGFDFDVAYGTDDDTDGAGGLDNLDVVIQNDEIGADSRISSGETAYYAIRATAANAGAGDHDDYARLSFNAFTTAGPNQEVIYRSDDSSFKLLTVQAAATNALDMNAVRLDFTSLAGTQVTE